MAEGTAQQVLKLVTEADVKGFETIKTGLNELGTLAEQITTKFAGIGGGGGEGAGGGALSALKTGLTELGTAAETTGTELGHALSAAGGEANTGGIDKIKTDLTETGTAAGTAATEIAKPLSALSGEANTGGIDKIKTDLTETGTAAGTAATEIAKPLHALSGEATTSGLTGIKSALTEAETAADTANTDLAKPLHALSGEASTGGLTGIKTALTEAETAADTATTDLAKPLHALSGEANTGGLVSLEEAIKQAGASALDTDGSISKLLTEMSAGVSTAGFDALKTDLSDIDSSAKTTSEDLGHLTASTEGMNPENITVLKTDLGEVSTSANTAAEDIGKLKTETTELNPEGVEKLKTELGEAATSAEHAESTFGELGAKVTEFGSQFAMAFGYQGAAQTLADFAKESLGFNDSLLKTQALAGASAEEMGKYKEGIDEMSKTIPVSAKDMADALFLVKSAGYDGQQALDVLKISSEAAAAGLGKTDTIANLVTSSLTAYKLAGSDAATITDALTTAVTQGKTSADALAPAIANVLPVASATGVSFQELAANLAVLTRIMPSADQASTALRSTLTAFIKPGKDASAVVEDLGTTFDDLRQELKEKGLLATLQDLMDKTGGNVDMLAKIFPNARALQDVLASAGAQGDSYAKVLDAMGKSSGATATAFGLMKDTVGNQAQLMRNQLQSEFDQVADKIFPLLVEGLKGLNTILPPLFEAIGKGFEPLKVALSFIGDHKEILAAFAIGIGVASVALYGEAAAAGAATLATTALDAALAVATAPFTLIALGVAALVLGIIELVKHWDDITKAVPALGQAWDGVVKAADAVAARFKELASVIADAVAAIVDGIKAHWDTIVDIFKGPFEIIAGVLKGLFDVIKDTVTTGLKVVGDAFSIFGDIVSGNWKQAWNDIKKLVGDAFDGIKTLVGDQLKALGAVLGGFGDIVKPLWSAAWNVLKDALGPIWDGFKTAVTSAWDATTGIMSKVLDGVKAGIKALGDIAGGVLGDLATALSTAWTAIATAVTSAWDAATGIASKILDGVKAGIKALGDAAGGVLGDLASALSTAWKAITTAVTGAWDATTGIASKILDGIKAGITALGDAAGGVLGDLATALSTAWTAITTAVTNAWDAATGIGSKILDGIKGAITALGDEAGGVLGDLASALSKVWTVITSAVENAWDFYTGIGSKILDGIKGAITSLGDKAGGIFGTLFTNITTVFGDIKQWFIDHTKELADAIAQPFKDFGDGIEGILKSGLNKGIDVFNGFLGMAVKFFNAVADAVNWVTSKLGLGDIMSKRELTFSVPHLATGTSHFRGGLAMVGEVGPELVYLPQGAAVLPAHETNRVAPEVVDSQGQRRRVLGPPREGIDIPGFFLGLDPGKVLDTIKGAWQAVQGFAKEWLAKGAEALVSTAFNTFGVGSLAGAGVVGDIGKGIATEVKTGVVSGIKELLGIAAKAEPHATALAGGPMASEIVAWANAHAKSLGIDARTLATALVASSAFETGLQDVGEIDPSQNPGGVAGAGPFQITPASKATDLGYNPHTATGSLDYFLASGDMRTGVQAILAAIHEGVNAEMAARAWEEYAGRPNAADLAARTANGDWDRAYQAAVAMVGGAASPSAIGAQGAWHKPLGGSYTITQSFGPADASVAGMEPGGFHEGIDMASFRGDPVLAALTGVVKAAGEGAWSPGLGIATIIDHGQGLVTIYGHQLGVTAGPGMVVNAGDPIGAEDSTGASTGDHLHFQVNQNGVPVDPRQFIALANGGWITEPVLGFGRSGAMYSLGERGPERVVANGAADHSTNVLSQFIVDSTLMAEQVYKGTDKNIRMRGAFP